MSSEKSVRKRTHADSATSLTIEYKKHRGQRQEEKEDLCISPVAKQPSTNTDPSEASLIECGKPTVEVSVTKEEDMDLVLGEFRTLAQNLHPETHDMRRKLLDPTINDLFVSMKKELGKKGAKIQQLTEELEAVNFSPSSLTGKRLLAKCRSLQHENDELGKRLCQDRVAQYELEIAMQKNLLDELKENLLESDRLIATLDDEVETLQSRAFNLQARVDFCSKHHAHQ